MAGMTGRGIPEGFRRVATDEKGEFALAIARPAAETSSDAHFLVLVFARGLLRHLISRMYLGDEVRQRQRCRAFAGSFGPARHTHRPRG